MSFGFLCPESASFAVAFALAAMAVVALPMAVGAGFISALIKFVRELIGASKRP